MIKKCIAISIIKLWLFINQCSLFIRYYSMLFIKIKQLQSIKCTWTSFILFQSVSCHIIQITLRLTNMFQVVHSNAVVDYGRVSHSKKLCYINNNKRKTQNLIKRVLKNQMEIAEVSFFNQHTISTFKISTDQQMLVPKIIIRFTTLEINIKLMQEFHLTWVHLG